MRIASLLIAAAGFLPLFPTAASAQNTLVVEHPLTRIAEIEVDPAQIEPFRAALREGIEAAVRLEPGVLALYAVSVQGRPEQVRVFEVYASQAAYQAHIQTLHFRKYKTATASMVRLLKLIYTDPIQLGSKAVSTR